MAAGFEPADEAEWQRLIDVGRSGGRSRLVSPTLDDIPVGPVHAAGHGPVLAMRAGAPWTIVERVDTGPAAPARAAIAAALAGGATGLEMVYRTSAAAYGRGIDPDEDPPVLDASILADRPDVAVRVDAGVETPRIVAAVEAPHRHAAYDPVSTRAARTVPTPVERCYAEIARLVAAGAVTTAFAADGRLWHNGGATEAQELGIALASIAESLRILARHGCTPRASASRIGVILAADADQFLTMTKLRAMRLLLRRFGEVAGIAVDAPIHAETSWRMLGLREPTMNLVRATTAAFAAATGGANSITVLAPLPNDAAFANRMARNVQTILTEEAALHRAADPGAGSGAVEDLTGRLAAAAWEHFTGIEREGGLLAAIGSGSILRTVAAARDARLRAVAERRLPLVGVNVNVDADAPVPAYAEDGGAASGGLVAIRLAAPIEAIAARVGGARIALLKAGAGAPAELRDALASLGFRVVALRAPDDVDGQSPPAIACVAVGEDAGGTAAEMAEGLRARGIGTLVAATRSPDALPAGFDAVAGPETDLVALFTGLLDRIADRQENGQVSKQGRTGRES